MGCTNSAFASSLLYYIYVCTNSSETTTTINIRSKSLQILTHSLNTSQGICDESRGLSIVSFIHQILSIRFIPRKNIVILILCEDNGKGKRTTRVRERKSLDSSRVTFGQEEEDNLETLNEMKPGRWDLREQECSFVIIITRTTRLDRSGPDTTSTRPHSPTLLDVISSRNATTNGRTAARNSCVCTRIFTSTSPPPR